MRIFVTGANGFVGRAFCVEALSRGHQVLGLSRQTSDAPFELTIGSLADPPWSVIEDFKPEALVHLAWIATPGIYLNSPENGVLLTQSQVFIQELAKRGVKRIIGAGTCIEYAASDSPLRERESALNPSFDYAKAKSALGQWLDQERSSLGITSAWLRIFYPYGPGEHPSRLPSLVMQRLAAGVPVELRTPDSIKDYIYVDDLAACISAVLESPLTGPINAGTGTGIRIEDMALAAAEVLQVAPSLVTRADPTTVDPWPVQIAHPVRLLEIDWKPNISLKTGLARLARSLSLL
jgi:dTDP-6-deoxy-L-talose 4-dehydrogenase (NAD+)